MVRLKELWAHMYNSVSTPAISLRTVRLIGLDKLGSPLGVWGLWLSPFLKCSIGHCMYGNFRPFSRICFCHSPPCNTTTQEQQRVKFNTRVERQLPRPSNIIYTFGANTKPLGAKVWGKSDNKSFQRHRTFRYFSFLSLTFWFWTSRCGSFICFPMISLRNRKCVTDRKLSSLLMRTAFCRGGI